MRRGSTGKCPALSPQHRGMPMQAAHAGALLLSRGWNFGLDLSKPHQCALMVLAAGMPRAGSTWQGKMVSSALQQLGVPAQHQNYWDYPKHTHMNRSKAAAWYANEYRAWSKLSSNAVVLYKSHEFVQDATKLCNRTAVVTIHRCLDHELKSIVGAGWVAPSALRAVQKMQRRRTSIKRC